MVTEAQLRRRLRPCRQRRLGRIEHAVHAPSRPGLGDARTRRHSSRHSFEPLCRCATRCTAIHANAFGPRSAQSRTRIDARSGSLASATGPTQPLRSHSPRRATSSRATAMPAQTARQPRGRVQPTGCRVGHDEQNCHAPGTERPSSGVPSDAATNAYEPQRSEQGDADQRCRSASPTTARPSEHRSPRYQPQVGSALAGDSAGVAVEVETSSAADTAAGVRDELGDRVRLPRSRPDSTPETDVSSVGLAEPPRTIGRDRDRHDPGTANAPVQQHRRPRPRR